MKKEVVTFPRQQEEVLRLLAQGLSITEIANEMGLAYRTITSYLQIIRGKLDIKPISSLAVWAYQNLPSTNVKKKQKRRVSSVRKRG